MKRFILRVFALIILAVAGLAYAQYAGMKPLTGQFDITGRTPIDPEPQEPRDTHFRIYLTGDAAKTMFEHMKVEPTPDICDEENGPLTKRIGGLFCTPVEGESGYECWFAIDIAKQVISAAGAC